MTKNALNFHGWFPKLVVQILISAKYPKDNSYESSVAAQAKHVVTVV
jgi:hypothetical protein